MIRWSPLAAMACVLVSSSGAAAQQAALPATVLWPSPAAFGRVAPGTHTPESGLLAPARGGAPGLAIAWSVRDTAPRPAPWWAPVASAALPGAGQVALGQWRAVGYAVLETVGWVQHLRSNSDGRRERREYQRLARIARAHFSESLPNGDQAYYERMLHYVESGVFDAVPGGALEPEIDDATYNGSIWLLARRTYWEDPDQPPPRESEAYRDAEDFYLARAIRPEFQWSWTNAQLEMSLFRDAIVRSNDAFRDAGFYLGAILVNHALSTVDAYITVRLRSEAAGARRFGLEGSIPWAPFGRPGGLSSHRR